MCVATPYRVSQAAAWPLALVAVLVAACPGGTVSSPDLAGAPGADLGATGVHDLSVPPGGDASVPPGAPDLATNNGGGGDGSVAPPMGQFFPNGAPWYEDVTNAMPDSESNAVIMGLAAAGGWGNGNKLQIDTSIEVLTADANTPLEMWNKTGDWYSPDCDFAPMPVPPGGAVEGETGYACTQGGDCHLLVVYPPTQKLYEMWRADIEGNVFNGGCLAVWDMTRVYPGSGRGQDCTSADAAGYPIAPLLFTADEVAAGAINHAIRFILPNSRIRAGIYVHPSTHSTGATSGGPTLPPYGAHFRLRPDFPMASLPNDGARTVARALQKYGMFLADGGNIALTARSDRSTVAKWANVLGSHDLFALQVSDFAMVDGGTRYTFMGNCVRNP